jgi:hypothetical protein
LDLRKFAFLACSSSCFDDFIIVIIVIIILILINSILVRILAHIFVGIPF